MGQVYLDLKDLDAFAVDVKVGQKNITPFGVYTRCPCTHDEIMNPWQVISRHLGEDTAYRLELLNSANN